MKVNKKILISILPLIGITFLSLLIQYGNSILEKDSQEKLMGAVNLSQQALSVINLQSYEINQNILLLGYLVGLPIESSGYGEIDPEINEAQNQFQNGVISQNELFRKARDRTQEVLHKRVKYYNTYVDDFRGSLATEPQLYFIKWRTIIFVSYLLQILAIIILIYVNVKAPSIKVIS
jgi:hypothetical protein